MSIATEIQRLQSAKAAIKASIEDKGVTVPSTTKLDGYADLVDDIQTGTSFPIVIYNSTTSYIYCPEHGVPGDTVYFVDYSSPANWNTYSANATIRNIRSDTNTRTLAFTMPSRAVYIDVLGDGCFVAGTQVLMGDGSTQAIESVEVGSTIATYNETSGKIETGKVELFTLRCGEVDAVSLAFADGTEITASEEHPFFTQDGYKKAAELTTTDKVLNNDRKLIAISSISKHVLPDAGVFTLTVDGNSNFFANGMLVHNKPA